MRHFHNYFDGTMTEHCVIASHKTMTASSKVVKHANNAIPNALYTQEQSPPTST